MKENKFELLAPAGSFEKLVCAVEFGADAVYAGLPDFSLRARINKFDQEQMIEAINYVHTRNRKIYITTNIFAHNYHFDILQKHLKVLKKNPPDAFIASDIGVIQIIKKIMPGVDIHLSTQANTTNWQTAKFWYEQGVKRIVLARELTLEEIKEIHLKVPKLELEYFVHGAMCMAYSGRCLLSSWVVGRSSNLGDCAQNCRWEYSLVEKNRSNDYIPVEQDGNGTYLLNSKDLCLIEYLDELKDAGITSFKIEGRAKSVYYLSQIVKSYRQALDIKTGDSEKKKKIQKIKKEIGKLVSRTYTTGFLFGECKFKGQETKFSHTEEEYMFVGEVSKVKSKNHALERHRMLKDESKKNPTLNKGGVGVVKKLGISLVKIRVHNSLLAGDRVEFIQPNNDNIFCKIKNIYDDKTLEKLKSAHGGQDRMVYIEVSKMPEVFSVMRKKIKK
ncbi:U32 family peptidase [Candidatus Parcubacteria bacterium]|nr:U32 family peptidase [Candidatus Parcubacteria bacterium]